MKIIDYIKGENKGSIMIDTYAGKITYIAVTATKIKDYKTLEEAEKFMAAHEYKKAEN